MAVSYTHLDVYKRQGYELRPQYQAKGIMSEAVKFMIDHAFKDLDLTKIEAFTNKNNFNSIKLLRKFNFILNENRADEKFSENIIFELIKS